MAKKITAKEAAKRLIKLGYDFEGGTNPRWAVIDNFMKINNIPSDVLKPTVKANEGILADSTPTLKNSYINDSGTLVHEMDDGSIKKYGADGNVVDIDSAGKLISNVAGSHTLGSDLTNKETVDLSAEQQQYLGSTFGNPKMSDRQWVNEQDKSLGKWNADNQSERDYGGRDGILRGRGSRVIDLVNQGANVYVADDGNVMLQTADGAEAKLNYGAAMQAYNHGLISGGKATWSAGGDEEGIVEDTTDDGTEEEVVQQSTQPVAPQGVPASIPIEPSAKDVQEALEIFTSTGVNLPTGSVDRPTSDFDTPILGGMEGTTEVEIPTFENKLQDQAAQFKQRAIDQAQLIKPQTLAEKTAAGTIGKLEQRLYRNPQGMNTYVLGVYNQEGVWTPSQAVPQGYVQVQQNNEGGVTSVTTGVDADGNPITYDKEGMSQEQANLTAGAIVNPAGTATAAPVNQMTGEEEGTVMSATTGQALGTAPVVDDIAQVDKVTNATATTQKQKVDEQGNPMVDVDGNPIMEDIKAVTADVKTAQEGVQGELDKTNAQKGTVTKEIQAQTQDTTKVGDVEAAQGTAAKVEGAPTRTLQDGELIDGSAVDTDKVESVFGSGEAKAVSATDEAEKVYEQFDDGKTPVWARQPMQAATDRLNQLGLSASSLAGQAIVQAMMESSMPLIQMNTANKQEMAMESARQRAAFMKQDFDQNFQTKVMNASKVSEIANMNFTAQQQIALENANMAQTMNLANLSNKQAIVMAEAAQISQLELTSLNNRQQAQVQNAQNFLAMDMANLNNAQATEIFKAQTMSNTLLSDTAAENANAQFNASSENQVSQFYKTMQSQLSQFNSAQTNAMKQFNAGETNAMQKFNSEIQSARETFNSQMYAQIAQANAKWRQDTTTTNNANLNASNFQYAKDVNGLTNKSIDEIWQRERDIMSFAFNASEGAKDRVLGLMLADKKLEGIRAQLDQANDDAFTSNVMSLMFGTGGLGSLFGGKGLLGGLDIFS